MKRAWPEILPEDVARVHECLESGQLWRGDGGRFLRELEEKFAHLHGCRYALAVTNGTHALEIALASCGVGYGDEVLVPAFTFVACATAVLARNAIPIPVEVEPDTFCLSPDHILKQLTHRTRAILAVHLCGHSCDMQAIQQIASTNGLAVIEDCAQAHGAWFRDRPVGSIGAIGAFSFQAGKAMTAGEGGMVVMNDPGLYQTAYSLMNCGRMVNGPNNHYVLRGSNFRMPELLAALLVGQIERLDAQNRRRQTAAAHVSALLSEIDGITPQARRDYATEVTYSLYMFRYDPRAFGGLPRDAFIQALQKSGFEANAGHPLFFQAPFYRQLRDEMPHISDFNSCWDGTEDPCPVAQAVSDQVVWFRHVLLLEDQARLTALADATREIQALQRAPRQTKIAR
jgi:3-amino-5-hydroxybenzoate synthase